MSDKFWDIIFGDDTEGYISFIRMVIAVLIICLLIAGICVGIGKLFDGESPPYQTSEFQWKGDTDSLVKVLCEKEDISYLISCPKCVFGGAFLQQESNGSMYYGFHHTSSVALTERKQEESIDLNEIYCGQTYCNKCRYPIGTDWRVIKYPRDASIITTGPIGSCTADELSSEGLWPKEEVEDK